jgi:hypothetical protein
MSLSRASVKKVGVMYFEHFARNNFYLEKCSFSTARSSLHAIKELNKFDVN